MANKNKLGASFVRHLKRQERLIAKIDDRERKGKNRENTDHVFNQYRYTDKGERVWTF